MKKIKKILIANRAEISQRVQKTCREMGIYSVAVFSDADKNEPFVRQADEAVYIGESNPSLSYLDQDKIIAAAKKVNADAIHPGYGFLSENASFARKCKQEGIIFIGPNPDAIEAMGSKSAAKSLMKKNGVPIIDGYQGADQSEETLIEESKKIGFPLLLKATAGGGGKGMRIVRDQSQLKDEIAAAKRESKSAFGNDELIIEKYIESGRHIEFQIFGDKHGNVLHMFERECTVQRRYQKVIEESPSPVMNDSLREKMSTAAINAAKALNYDNAGTVEFIYDDNSGEFYFLEVNTRLQVEHPVTEAITGLDLVKMQIESAEGRALSLTQEQIRAKGYAVEVRLYAENASQNYQPVTGRIHKFTIPKVDGLRVDSGIESGSDISVFYDPMIAKLIVWADSRNEAHNKMSYVLDMLICQGITTNQNLLSAVLKDEDFRNGNYNIHYLKEKESILIGDSISVKNITKASIAAIMYDWNFRESKRGLLRSIPSGWRNSFYAFNKEIFLSREVEHILLYRYLGNNKFLFKNQDKEEITFHVEFVAFQNDILRISIDEIQSSYTILKNGNQFFVNNQNVGNIILQQKERFPEREKEKIKGGYEAPMPSQIVSILVQENQKVKQGDPLIVISSMKMENTISAEENGVVKEVYAKEGKNVEAGFLLMKIEQN